MAQRPNENDLKLDNLTRQDLKKIERSMKQPGFMGLLNEYMVQISDPKNKNEYDEYLRQMQRQHELPKHMKIVEVKAVFCFRTFIVSQKNKKHEMKFFVNMCESEYLERPACEAQGTGYSWKVPNSMGKIRYDQDRNHNPCQVVDIAFHQDTFYFAARKEFKEMIINIALEAAEKQLGERKETLSRDYVILQNVKCKGVDGKPALMPIRYIQGKIYNKGEGPSNDPERDLEGKETKLQKEINKQKEQFEQDRHKEQPKEDDMKPEELEDNKQLVLDLEEGLQRPKYSTILTYPVEYSEFIDSPYTNRQKVPAAFNLELQIPRVQSMEEIAGQTLEINEKRVVLQIAQKYFMDLEWSELKLKYTLLTAKAKAKYDRKKKCLRITIPIDQSVRYESQPEIQQKWVHPVQQPAAQVLENETWKNRVLEFTDPSVTVKVLQQNEHREAEKAALVQEIDEEDIVEEKPTEHTSIVKTEEEEEIQARPAQKFSLGSYYNKEKEGKSEGESLRLGYVFQETADKVVVVFQLKNYQKEDVKTVANRSEILVLWNSRYQHLKIAETLSESIVKVEVVLRVGFIAVMLLKAAAAKAKYFQKESLEEIQHQGATSQEQFKHFTAYFHYLEQQAQKEEQQAQKEEQQAQKDERGSHLANQTHPAQAAQMASLQETKSTTQETKQTKLPAKNVTNQQRQSQKQEIQQQIGQGSREQTRKQAQAMPAAGKQLLSRTVQPQFIQFHVAFAQNLD